jgi:hypothetical protein
MSDMYDDHDRRKIDTAQGKRPNEELSALDEVHGDNSMKGQRLATHPVSSALRTLLQPTVFCLA